KSSFQHYARHDYFHNTQNGALSSDTGRSTYSRIPYGAQNSGEYYSEQYDLSNQGPVEYSSECQLTSDKVPTTVDKSNNSYGFDYLDSYEAQEQRDGESESVDNWNENNTVVAVQYGFEYASQKCTSSKLLPKLPVNKNGSGSSKPSATQMDMQFKAEGMCIERDQRYGVCMATADEYDRRLLPGDYQNIYANNLNGYAGFACSSTFLNNAVPAAPSRALPHTARSSFYLSQDIFGLNTDAAQREELSQCGFGMDQTTAMGSGSNAYDALENMSRPYTSMLPLDYSDNQECYYNTDNLSTYSDTPPSNNSQLKLQKQRKISLMMAMTTASVIASGETRVAVHTKHSKKPTEIQTDSILGSSISTNAATRASEMFLEPECCGGIVTPGGASAVTGTPPAAMATISKTRKLPKVLPTPQYKSSHLTNTTATDALSSPLYSSDPIADKSLRPKQLPKLPTSSSQNKTYSMPNSNLTTYPAPDALSLNSLDQKSASPPSPTTKTVTTTSYPSLAIFNEASHKKFVYPYDSIEPKEVFSIKSIDANPTPSWTPSPPIQSKQCLTPPVELPYSVIKQNSPPCHLPEIDKAKSDIKPNPDLHENLIESILERKKSPEPYSEPESALFNISEYLKPYTLDIIAFSGEKENHITNAASTSTTTHPCYGDGKLSGELSKLKSTEPSGDSHLFPYSNTWTTNCVNYQPSEVESDANIQTQPCTSTTQAEAMSPLRSSIPPLSISLNFTSDNIKEEILFSTTSSPPDKNTTGNCSPSYNAFTTTVYSNNHEVVPVTTSQNATPSPSTLTLRSPSSLARILSYTDYMKQFELPDLPQPIMDLSENNPVTPSVSDAVTINTATNAEVFTPCKEFDVASKCSEQPSHFSELFDAHNAPSFLMENQESPINDQIDNSSNIVTAPTVPITTIVCSVDPPNRSNFMPEAEAIVNHAVAFDDSFYDSFNVDIRELTASVANIEPENSLSNVPISTMDNSLIINNKSSIEFDIEKSVDTTDMNQNLSSGQGGYYKPSQTQQKTNVVASAATSVLGGISKGLKGGLDGVFSGVSSTVEVTQTTSTTKKGFSFNLASKLVPSVGGLLSSSNSSKQTQAPRVETTSTFIITSAEIVSNDSITYVTTTSPSCLYTNTEDNLYAVTVPNTFEVDNFYHEAVIQTNSALEGNICDNYDECYDEMILTDKIMSVGMLDRESEYGLIENPYSYHVTGEGQSDTINAYNKSQKDIPIESGFGIEQSKIKSVPTHFHESTTKKIGGTTSVGMFGSILGKAAAAVQSATHAVNQGASSVASVVAQTPLVGPTTHDVRDLSITSSPNAMKRDSDMSSVGFKAMNIDYSYQLTNEESLSSHYANTGDDYENSNIKMHEYNTYTDNKAFANYHSNGNQSQFKDDTVISGQPKVIGNGTKILPTVPPAGSTGKKLPTVNGKSGILIKQMPTEIYDDESELDELDVSPSIGKEPSYRIDSEQDDYYMDLQQTTPSNQPNGFYEHVNNGYDYREDYFNEEDEYKYLEQQREQEQQHQPKDKKYLKQTKGVLSTTQPQSSLDFIDEGQDDDFIYENYHSEEDSGNYLDESSSGSVGPIEGRNFKMDSNGEASLTSISNQMKGETFTNNTLHKHDTVIGESTSNLTGFINEKICPDLDERDEDINDQLSDLTDLNKLLPQKKKPLLRGETEEVVGGHMQMIRQPEITARQRWHWAYNKIIMQLNVST
ncbi:hypothetical protein KR084_008912, partial [Drosophila pseudotakahashii]